MDLRATRPDDRTEPRTGTASGGTATLLAPARPRTEGQVAGGNAVDRPSVEAWDAPEAEPQGPAPAVAPRGNLAIWLVLAGIVACVLVGELVSARAGVLGVSGTLAACAVVRAVAGTPGPVGLVIRGRVLDVVMFAGLSGAILVLGLTAPGL